MITLLLTHLDAAGVAASLAQYPSSARVVVCHGGGREDFEQVEHADKLFIEDPSLRGPLDGQSYAAVLTQAWNEAVAASEADLIYLVEYDHIVLRPDYERALRTAIDHAGADFLGKNCSRRDDTNWTHALRARSDPRMRRFAQLWGCLGTGMLFRRAALEAFAGVEHDPGYLELYVPTVLHDLGFRLDDVDRFSDLYAHVNAPPEKDLAALRAARSEGHFFFHPFKRVDLV